MKKENTKFLVFSERLNLALKNRQMTKSELARRVGIDKSNITIYTTGRGKKSIPNGENLQAIANALGVTTKWLLGEDERHESNILPVTGDMRTINIYSYISCGEGEFNDGAIVDTITLPADMFQENREYFGMYAKGDSMTGVGISDGDLLIFERTDVPVNNKIGAFCIDNEYAYCKKYQSHNGKIFLLSANDSYAPITIEPSECFRCVGVLKKILKDI